MFNLISFVTALVVLSYMLWFFWRSNKECKALFAHCDAEEALWEWRHQHPNMHVGKFSNGRRLVQKALDAYDEFIRWHPYCEKGHKEYLLSLLNVPSP